MIWAIALLGGCPSPCDGPGCDAIYDGSLLTIHQGRALSVSGDALDPTAGWVTVEGIESEGPDWSVTIGDGLALAGAWEPGRVWALPVPADGADIATLDPPYIVSEDLGDAFGYALDRVPDMDGDGRAELLVGAPDRLGAGTDIEAGAAYLFSGLGDGWSDNRVAEQFDLRVLAESAESHLGRTVAGCEDVDGDGLGDALIGAWWSGDGVAPLGGEVFLLRSSDAFSGEVLAGELGVSWTGSGVGEQLGRSLRCRHEMLAPADGLVELVIGAPFTAGNDGSSGVGAVYIVPGGARGGAVEEASALTLRGLGAESYFGWAVASGDLDGDGLAELAVGAPGSEGAAGPGSGEVTVYSAAALRGGLGATDWLIRGDTTSAQFGSALEIADLNGDGYGDLLVGAPRAEPGGIFAAGVLYVFAGDAADWEALMGPDTADATWYTERPFLRTGGTIGVGDADGDGRAEMALVLGIEPG